MSWRNNIISRAVRVFEVFQDGDTARPSVQGFAYTLNHNKRREEMCLQLNEIVAKLEYFIWHLNQRASRYAFVIVGKLLVHDTARQCVV